MQLRYQKQLKAIEKFECISSRHNTHGNSFCRPMRYYSGRKLPDEATDSLIYEVESLQSIANDC